MSESTDHDFSELPEPLMVKINELCNSFEDSWRSGEPVSLTKALEGLSADEKLAAARELIPIEVGYRIGEGQQVSLSEYRASFPDLEESFFVELEEQTMVQPTSAPSPVPQPVAAMSKPQTIEELRDRLITLELLTAATFDQVVRKFDEPVLHEVVEELVAQKLLTPFQSQVLLQGWSDPLRLGEYIVTDRIGAGGMGSVYRATHKRMNRQVALKILRPELTQNPQQLRRFEREMQAAAKLNHPNIVTAYDAGEANGVHFLITQLVEVRDLAQLIRNDGPVPPDRAIDYITQVAEGLQYAHDNGIVHRDIKPGNLLLDSSGQIKIVDMGLAQLTREVGEQDQTVTNLTHSGYVVGTATYMSPEQGRNAKAVDHRTDIYSLGCTLYFLLTGKAVYVGESVIDTLLAHVNNPVPSLSEATPVHIPKALDAVFKKMIAKSPDDRYQSMNEVVEALKAIQPTASPQDSKSSNIGAKILMAIVPIVAAIGFVFLIVNFSESRQSQTTIVDPSLPPTVEQATVPGLAFNGQNSFVHVPSLTYDPNRSFTVEAFVTVRDARDSNLVSWLGVNWFALYINSSRWGVARQLDNGSILEHATQRAALNRPVHVAGIWNHEQNELSLFINGQQVQTTREAFNLGNTTGGLFIGGVAPGKLPNDRYFDGVLHSMRIAEGILYDADFTPPIYFPSPMPGDAILAQYNCEFGDGDELFDETTNGHDGQISNASWVK